MPYEIGVLDGPERVREKQRSRDADARRLASGEVSRAQLTEENGFFSSIPFHQFRIVSIGGRPFRQAA